MLKRERRKFSVEYVRINRKSVVRCRFRRGREECQARSRGQGQRHHRLHEGKDEEAGGGFARDIRNDQVCKCYMLPSHFIFYKHCSH